MAKKFTHPIFSSKTSTFNFSSCIVGACKVLSCMMGRDETVAYLSFSLFLVNRRLPYGCDRAKDRCLSLPICDHVLAKETFTIVGLVCGDSGEVLFVEEEEVECTELAGGCCCRSLVASIMYGLE